MPPPAAGRSESVPTGAAERHCGHPSSGDREEESALRALGARFSRVVDGGAQWPARFGSTGRLGMLGSPTPSGRHGILHVGETRWRHVPQRGMITRLMVTPREPENRWTLESQRGYDRHLAATSSRASALISASTARAALLAGFAVVFGLWLLWGYQLVRDLRQFEQSVSTVDDSYLRGEQILSRLRTNVLLGSIYLRDALIDGGTARRETYRSELTRLRTEAEQLLRSYLPDVGSQEERDNWARLQLELRDYWVSREVAFTEPSMTPAEAAALLRGRLLPQRNTVLQVLDQVSALQAIANRRRREEIDALYHEVRTRFLAMGGGALLLAIVVAVMVSRQVHRLQRQIELQRGIEQGNREDLERLSARLVSVQEQERRTLARELHDEVGQALTAVKMDIGIALRAQVDPRARNALEEARDISETMLRSVRDMSQLLHPSVLDDFGLPATLSTYLRNFSERTGIRAQLAETMEARLAPEIELCV